jgi:hypothetical protein
MSEWRYLVENSGCVWLRFSEVNIQGKVGQQEHRDVHDYLKSKKDGSVKLIQYATKIC